MKPCEARASPMKSYGVRAKAISQGVGVYGSLLRKATAGGVVTTKVVLTLEHPLFSPPLKRMC
jgi:hypothetical protein